MSKVFDVSELVAYAQSLAQAGLEGPKKRGKFLRKEGTKLRNATKKEAKRVHKVTGNYVKSIKRGKVYQYQKDLMAVRVYSSAPHAHLVEDGHRMVTHDGWEVGFVPGYHVFEVSGKDFEPQYLADLDDYLDEVVEEL